MAHNGSQAEMAVSLPCGARLRFSGAGLDVIHPVARASLVFSLHFAVSVFLSPLGGRGKGDRGSAPANASGV